MNDILSGLNEKQREAVRATEGFVRVIAGAGSGKTRALAHRYAYLVRAGGIHPGNILCVTFTRKAAGEMKRRVRSLIGDAGDTSLITTYHGFCVRVLRESIGRLFWPESFTILDTRDQKRLLEDIYRELDLKLDHASFENIIEKIQKLKATTGYTDKLISRDVIRVPEDTASLDDKIINRYLSRQRKIFALDFDDLINFTFVLFDKFPDVRESWQKRLFYIQVDEFQDSSERELKLIDTVSAFNRNLFVVGDPDQNIYEWRGAKVEILVDFDKTHENTATVVMDRNYRSTKKILACANELIDKNQMRVKKSLYTESDAGEDVIWLHSRTEEAEAVSIISTIRELLAKGLKYSDIAVLYRASFISQFLESAFMRAGVPYELVGGARFFDRMEIVDATAYLTLIDHDDDEAFVRIANKPRRRLGRTAVERIKAEAAASGKSCLSLLRDFCETREFINTGAAEFVGTIDNLRRAAKDGIAVSELLDRALVESGYEKYIRESGNMERFENLTELKRFALETEQSKGKSSPGDELPPEPMSLGEFLQNIALMREEGDESEHKSDRVNMMTIHSAKGLEFPAVFVVGMTEGIFPSSRTIEERRQSGLEEERRLCFVALTRAMKYLYLTDSEGTGPGGKAKTPSRFMFEMGENNYRRIGDISPKLAEKAKNMPSPSAPSTVLSPGDEVDHVMFGHGRIESVDEERHVYIIRFDKTGAVRPISDDYDFSLWRRLAEESAAEQGASDLPDIEVRHTELAEETSGGSQPAAIAEPPVIEPPELTPKEDHEPRSYAAANKKPGGRKIPARGQPDRQPDQLSFGDALSASDAESAEAEADDVPDCVIETVDDADFEEADQSFSPADTAYNKNEPPRDEPVSEKAPKAKNKAVNNGDYPNLWNDPSVPKTGWVCTGITDLGEPAGICAMCGRQVIRYVHHMRHDDYRDLGVGRICAGKMEGDPDRARRRENDFKQREKRKATFVGHVRKRSKNGNEYFKYKGENVVLLEDRFNKGYYKAVVRGTFTQSFKDKRGALEAAFDIIDSLTVK